MTLSRAIDQAETRPLELVVMQESAANQSDNPLVTVSSPAKPMPTWMSKASEAAKVYSLASLAHEMSFIDEWGGSRVPPVHRCARRSRTIVTRERQHSLGSH